MQDFFELVEREGWMYKLPKDAHLMHDPAHGKQQDQSHGGAPRPLQQQRQLVPVPSLPVNGLKRKRTAAMMEKENEPDTPLLQPSSPRKKRRVMVEKTPSASRGSRVAAATAILRGRAVLKDVVMEDQTL